VNHPAEQPSFQTEPAGHAEPSAPQATLEFAPSGLLVYRPGERPLRQPLRSDAVALPLLEVLLASAAEAGERKIACGDWTAKDVLVRAVISPDCVDKSGAYKKAVSSLRKFLARNALGTVECSGDGQARFVAAPGSTIAVRRRT
jgi:hypothetical protein